MSTPSFHIKPIGEDDYKDVLKFLQRTFYIQEPLNNAVGLISEASPTCSDLDDYCLRALKQEISFKAVDDSDNIIGCVINAIEPLKEPEDGTDMLSLAKNCKDKKFQKIIYILARRISGTRLWERYPQDEKLLDIAIASTDPSWRRRGIMNELVKETEKKVKELGLKILRLDTSSAYSAKSAERCGFTCIYDVAYADIKLDGQPLIVPEPPHTQDKVFIKIIE